VLIYRAATGAIDVVRLAGPVVSLEELQRAVGGYIEVVPGTRMRAFCNEDGHRLQLPRNAFASTRFHQLLVGDVAALEPGERAE
jgi:hypothetical protein